MRRIFTSLVGSAIFVLGGFSVSGQSISLDGSINADSGTVYLNYVSDDAYYRSGSGSLEATVHNGKFVFRDSLVDFWFSHCGPCIERFHELKAVYRKHGGRDLEIVAISTDGQKDLGEWRTVIQREGFEWKQYLDKGGPFAHQLSIFNYPTNFLLDEKGVIVKRDIMPRRCRWFSVEHLGCLRSGMEV